MIFFTQKKWFGVTFLLAVIALGLSFFVSKLPLRNTEVPLPHDQDVVSSVPVVHDTLHIFKLPSSTQASIEYSNPPKTIFDWGIRGEQIVINGAYFLEDYTPAGFLVADGKRIGDTMFDQDKSGLLVIQDGQFSIRDLNIAPFTKNETFDFALQSFPFLIKDAKPAIQTDSGKYARRTAVGIDADKNIYILTATTKELTLYQFMTELLHTKIPFTYVLNLDGGPSTGVQANWNGEELLENSMTGVSSILRFQKSEK